MTDHEFEISKSQRKRDAEALQKLGQQITELNLMQIDSLDLPEPLKQAVLLYKNLKANGAKKRQLQFIGRVMRDIDDVDSIQKAYEILVQGSVEDTRGFKLIEQWRDRLLSSDSKALEEFVTKFPSANKKELSALIAQARNERDSKKNRGSAKALFRLVKSIIS